MSSTIFETPNYDVAHKEVVVPLVEEKEVAKEEEEEVEIVESRGEFMEFYDVFNDPRISTLYFDLDELSDEFAYPIDGSEKSSGYGIRSAKMHAGLDLRAPENSAIYSIFDGEVTYSDNYKDYGNVVLVSHTNGLETLYAHNSKNLVKVGDDVASGDRIALCGKSGNATGYHLHLELRASGKTIDPELLLDVDNEYLQEGILTLTKEAGGNITARLDAPKKSEGNASSIKPLDPSGSKGVLIDGKVYSAPETTPAEAEEVYHTIKRGDTLSGLAVEYSTTVAQICKLNNITTRTTIKTGQKLRIK